MIKKKIEVLILSKDLRNQGGVVNYIAMLINNFSPNVTYTHYAIDEFHRNSFIPNTLKNIRNYYRLVLLIRKRKWDCIHINPSFNVRSLTRDLLILSLLKMFSNSKVIIFFHGWDTNLIEKIEKNSLIRKLLVFLLNYASYIFVLATQFKSQLSKLGVNAKNISVTSTMFDGKIFNRFSPKTIEDSNDFVILFLSRFVKEKGIYEVLNAFKILLGKWPTLKLIMAGDGPEREGMEKWVYDNNMNQNVYFPGYIRGDAKIKTLTNADIFLFPTYYGEGCPVALLEAMAAGLPVITSSVGGIPDIFTNKRNGILLESINVQKIVDAVTELLMNKEFRREVAKCNYETAWKNYEAEIVTKNIENKYFEVINNGA